MEFAYRTLGIIGGSGMLGRSISTAVVRRNAIPARDFYVTNRTGGAMQIGRDNITATTDNQRLADACDVIILCVPPSAVADIGIHAPDKLIISVMAGVDLEQLRVLTGATRIIRAMSSPAAAHGLAYSPWCASAGVSDQDRAWVRHILATCGTEDEITDEAHIDYFTAMTGPVPGFVAFFAQTMVEYATKAGIAADIADRAIRQLFLASGTMMAQDAPTPAEHVADMIAYAGTTAAGLQEMQASPIAGHVANGLDAALRKCKDIAPS